MGARPNPPPYPEVPASAGLEGALQTAPKFLEGSFEAPASRAHLRMRVGVGVALRSRLLPQVTAA
ncbi:hypothetical protein FV234_01225 [Methylobacterium sp. WL8]|nr:hypothetical protein FV234_01225 [Methylobacterium sp. WL8]